MDSIRRAGPRDASAISAIGVEVWLGTYLRHGVGEACADHVLAAHGAQAVRGRLGSASHLCWASQNRDGIDGFLQMTAGARPPVKGCPPVEVATLCVEPRHQGQGRGSALLRTCLRHVAGLGGGGAWLTVNAASERAVAFYGRDGFVDVREAAFVLDAFVLDERAYENRVLTIGLLS